MASTASSRQRIARHRAAQRQRGLRAVTLWLPDTSDPVYRRRLVEECRSLAQLSPAEDELADAFSELVNRIKGWR